MDFSKVKLPEPASKAAFDAQLDDLIGGDDTGAEHHNPMLDETDEPTFLPGSTPAPAKQVSHDGQEVAATSTPDQPWKRDRTPEEQAALDTRAANGELLPGRKKKDAYSFGWLTSIDLEVIWTVASARLIKAESVQVARGWKRVEAAYKRLRRLENGGLVRAQRVVGVGQVWTVTKLGLRTLRANGFEARWTKGRTSEADAFPYVGPGDISLQNVQHTLALAHVRAQLLRGGYYDLRFGEEGSSPVAPAQLISEWTMKTSWEALTGPLRDGSRHEDRLVEASKVAAAYRQRVTEGRGTWEEAFISAPMLWVPAHPPVERNYRGQSGPESSVEHGGSHLPDLVVSRLASQDRLNVNTAVEVELTYKKGSDYARIFDAYSKRGGMYHRVVWLVPNESIERVMRKALEKLGKAAAQHVILPLNLDDVPILMSVDKRDQHRAERRTKRALPKSKVTGEFASPFRSAADRSAASGVSDG